MNNYSSSDFTVLRSLVLFFCGVVSYFLRTLLLTNCHVLLSLLYIFLLSAHTTVLSIFIYAVTCAWSLLYSHMCQMCIYNCYCFLIPASKWQFESHLWLLEFHVPLFTLCMGSWWLQQSLPNLCTVTCNITCLPQTHNTRLCWALLNECWSKVCPCPCSAISTVPGEDDYRARIGRAETRCVALGPLSSDSVYKAPWCSEKNGWTAGWGGTWWARKAIERSVSLSVSFFVHLLLCAICIEELKLIEFSFSS